MIGEERMERVKAARKWMEMARSVLLKAKAAAGRDGVFYEDLCFDLYQAAERALIAYLFYLQQGLPPVRGLEVMLTHMSLRGIAVPEWMRDLVKLDRYASVPKWPWFQRPVSKTDYWEALDLAERILEWVEEAFESEEMVQKFHNGR